MSSIILNTKEYSDKVLACWLGKNIGGTLGAPMEWRRQVNRVTFYTQDLKGEPLPNDDLDIQLLWLVALEEKGIALDARTLGDYWCLYVTPHWAEYGTAKANLRSGLIPPSPGPSTTHSGTAAAPLSAPKYGRALRPAVRAWPPGMRTMMPSSITAAAKARTRQFFAPPWRVRLFWWRT